MGTPYLPSLYHPFHILTTLLVTSFNDPTLSTIALKIISPVIVVVKETLKEEVVEVDVSHPLEIIQVVNLGSHILTTKLASKYVMEQIT